MLRDGRTDVLVVGAGPVGMLSALLLGRQGVPVAVIDKDWHTASRTYACALHPGTLKLLNRLGLTREVLASGRRVDKVAFYEGEARRAEVRLSDLSTEFPYVLVLPQSSFENLLERKLKADGNVAVNWNHQMSVLRPEGKGVVGVVDKLGVSAQGYSVPEMEWSIERTIEVHARYLIGADGPNSSVAQSLAAGYDTAGASEFYAVFEFQSDWQPNDELRVVLDDGATSVLWPLPDNRFRWSFQLLEEHLRDFPSKERRSIVIGDPASDQGNRDFVQRLIRERAPWFKGQIQEIGWSTDVEFARRVAKRFGDQRCWLAGDAAHQTGPAGMQSMNMGLLEAEQLTSCLTQILRDNASASVLDAYNQSCRAHWRGLLGLTGTPQPTAETSAWVKERSARILSSLPASGEDLRQLLHQLHLELP